MTPDGSHGRPLGARDRAVLDFERDWMTWQGDKDAQIRIRFGISSARYYQLLGRLLDHPAAEAYDPLLVARLRRRRAARSRLRTADRLGTRPGT
jgi:hypothetical protein